ncbi:MAG TPA: bifunctional phosphoglucose/phosphomannose isomerase [Candidatus Limnocylindria bacterium]|nr:bifunctional phosphoglucose/phosphomannose isomerase [Candidatus Limnocylindria bacterium]
MGSIDTVDEIRAGDPEGMLDRIKELPKQVREAWRIASAAQVAPQYGDVRSIVVSGMGGSAIGGDLAAALLQDELKIPMSVHRDYGLPAYVGRDTLVIASSYSGNTEETLSALDEARKRGAKVLALTTGGRLAELGKAQGFPVVTFSYKARPRAVLGYSLTLVLGVLSRLGFVRDLASDVESALADVAKLEERVHEGARTNDAKALAKELQGRIPFVYGAGPMAVMARRVKGQLNENSKNWAAFDAMPELNHNAVVGFPHPDAAKRDLVVLVLESDRDNPRVRVRWQVTKDLLDRAGVAHRTLRFPGSSALSEVLQMAYFTDYVTFYVAVLNGEDPSPNTSIDLLKERLAKA